MSRTAPAAAADQEAYIQQMRERVRRLAQDVERAARTDVPPEHFFAKLLDVLREAFGCPAAAVWSAEGGQLRLTHERGLSASGFRDIPRAEQAVAGLLSDTIATGESSVRDGSDAQSGLPTHHLYFTAALLADGVPIGAVTVLQRSDVPPDSYSGYLEYLEQLAGFGSVYLTRQAERRRGGSGEVIGGGFWGEFEQAVLLLQRARTVRDVAMTAANEARRLLNVDRVSVARRRGRKVPVEAVSGQDSVNKRANLTRRMSRLCRAVMKTGEPLVFAGDASELPPQVDRPLAEYLQESGSRMVLVLPLFDADRDLGRRHDDPDAPRTRKRRRVIGALFVERINESRGEPGLNQKLDLLADHVAAALQNAREHERLVIGTPLRLLGRATEWLHGRKLVKTLLAAGALAAVLATLWLVPYPYRVTGEGRLVPVEQHRVFAPFDGEVTEVTVEGGERVRAGDPLATLRNPDLAQELLALRQQIDEQQARRSAIFAQISEASAGGDQRRDREERLGRLEGELGVAEAELGGLIAREKLLAERAGRSRVVAPADGTVATFQVDRLLRNRPVGRGEVLMELMDDAGPWRLELRLPDSRMGHVADRIAAVGTESLPVEFVLASDPEHTYRATVTEIAGRFEPDPEEGNVVRVFAAPDDPAALPTLRIGTEVKAKVDCGPEPLGFVLFGDVVEFVRKNLWL